MILKYTIINFVLCSILGAIATTVFYGLAYNTLRLSPILIGALITGTIAASAFLTVEIRARRKKCGLG